MCSFFISKNIKQRKNKHTQRETEKNLLSNDSKVLHQTRRETEEGLLSNDSKPLRLAGDGFKQKTTEWNLSVG